MDVSVRYKRGQEWLRLAGRPSVFGQGLLDRARAISLALLGATAAVGLAIVALALNQSWPLVAGSSIPVIPSPHQAVGEASVAAGAPPGGSAASSSPLGGTRSAARGAGAGQRRESADAVVDPAPTASVELVVAPSSPAPPATGKHGPPEHEPAPAGQQPQGASPTSPEPPATEPAPSPSPTAAPPAQTTPPATTSGVPVDDSSSDPPSWSHGGGHAYGHDHDWDDDDDWDDDSHGWGGHGHGGWHGHHDD